MNPVISILDPTLNGTAGRTLNVKVTVVPSPDAPVATNALLKYIVVAPLVAVTLVTAEYVSAPMLGF